MKKFTKNFLHEEHGMLQVLRKIGLSMVAVLLAVVAFGQPQDTYHVYAEGESSCYLEDNAYKVTISFRDFVKIDSFSLTLDYNSDDFEVVDGSFDVLRDEISGATMTPSGGKLIFTWDINMESSTTDTFRSIEPNNDTTRVMCFELQLKSYNPFYETDPGMSFDSDLHWDAGAFWNDELDVTDILTDDKSGAESFTISQLWRDGIKVDTTQAVCNSDNVVATVIVPSDSDLEYSWNGDSDFTGEASTNIEAPAEDVTVVVRNSDGCISYQKRFDVATPTNVSFDVDNEVYTNCPGGKGDVEIEAKDGSEPYTYYLIPADGFNINNIGIGSPIGVFQVDTGTYYAAVQDVNECVDMTDMDWWETVVVMDTLNPWNVTPSVHKDNYCHGGEEGEIELTFNGASAPYIVTYDGEDSDPIAAGGTFSLGNDLIAGEYTVSAIDNEGCVWTEDYIITEPPAMYFEVGHTDASCDDAIGTIWLDLETLSGGTEPYSKWGISTVLPFNETDVTNAGNMYAIDDTAKNLPGDVYYVRLYDAEGCFEDYANEQDDDAVKLLTLKFDYEGTDPLCASDSGSVVAWLESGDGNHDLEYYLVGGDTLDLGETYKLPKQDPGSDTYDFAVIDHTKDCEFTFSVTIETPDPVELRILDRYTLIPTCPGGSDGLIAVQASGGTGPYTYKFDDRQWEEAEDYTTFAAEAEAHVIWVMDAEGCTAYDSIFLDVDENEVEFQDTIITNCAEEGVNLLHNNTLDSDDYSPEKTFIRNLSTDEGGYMTKFTWIGESKWHSGDIVDPGDHDFYDLEIWTSGGGYDTVALQGRVWQREPVLYITDVDPGTSSSAVFSTGEIVDTTTVLYAGTYWVAAKDEFGCVSAPEEILVIDPLPLAVTMEKEDAKCWGQTTGEIKLTATNAQGWINPPHGDDRRYEFYYTNQGEIFERSDWTEQVTWRPFIPSGGSGNTNDSTIVIDVTGESLYFIAVRDYCGVENPDLVWFSDTIDVSSFDEFLAESITSTSISCHYEEGDVGDLDVVKSEDGTIKVSTVVGGVPPYTFTVTGPDDYEDIVTLNEKESYTWTGLESGEYNVFGRDSYIGDGCPGIDVDITVGEPDLLHLELEHINPSCVGLHDGLLVYRINGGTADTIINELYYGYQEATNNIDDITDVDSLQWFDITPEIVAGDDNMISFNRAVKAGEYTVYIKDAKGCISGPYYKEVKDPKVLNVDLDGTAPYCTDDEGTQENGSITVAPSGGWESNDDDFFYIVKLTGPSSYSETVVLDADSTFTFEGLDEGSYTATVTEFNDSIAKYLGNDPFNETIDYFDYPNWDTIMMFAPYQNNEDCSKSFTIDLVYEELAYDTGYVTDVICYNSASGTLTVEGISGGVAPYFVMLQGPKDDEENIMGEWVDLDEDEVDHTFENLVHGHYTLHVKDSEGCWIYEESWEIENIDSLELTTELYAHPLCHDGDATVVLHAEGGTGVGTYKFALVDLYDETSFPADDQDAIDNLDWSEEMVDNDTFFVAHGTYIAFVMDANGCVQGFATDGGGAPILIHRVDVENPTAVVADDFEEGIEPSCYGEDDGEVTVPSVTGGSGGAYTAIVTGFDYLGREVFKVYTSDVTEDNEVVLDGLYAVMKDSVYSVVFQDNQKCESEVYTFELGQPEEFIVSVEVDQDAFICPDNLAGVFELTVIHGGVPFVGPGDDDFKYKWEVFDGHPDSTGTSAIVPATDWSFTSKYLGDADVWYRGTAMDLNGCEDDTIIYVSAPLEVEYEISDITCFEDTLGVAHIEVTQGNVGRTYEYMYIQVTGEDNDVPVTGGTSDWTAFDTDSTVTVTGLSFGEQASDGGHYFFYVRDNKGCVAPDTFITFVPVQTPLDINVDIADGECSDDATVAITGGIPPYVVTVDGVETDVTSFTWEAGEHTVSVVDAHSCTAADTITTVVDPVSSTITISTDLGADGVVNYDNGLVDTTLAIGTHVIEYEADGCTRTVTVIVEDVTPPAIVSMSPQGQLETDDTTFDLVLTLNDNVVKGLGAMKVFKGSDVVAEFDVTEVTIADNVISAPVVLDKYSVYYVNVPSGFVADAEGNQFAGISGETTWTFETKNFATGIPEVEGLDIKLYPNPFNDILNIKNAQELTRVIISNIAGQRVIDIEYPESVINTPNLVSGVYVVTMFTTDGVTKTERIVKR